MKHPTLEHKKGFKETKLGWIPEDWEVLQLSKLVYIDKSSLSSKTDPEEILNYVSLSDISEGRIVSNEYKFLEAPSRARRVTVKGDLLLATVRPNLKNFAIVQSDNLIASTGFAVLTEKKANNGFIYHYLFSVLSERQFHNLTVGSNYPALNSSDIKTFKIVTPPLPEQKAIATCLTTWDTAITKLNALIKTKQQLKKALMQQLLSGKKRLAGFSGEWEETRLGNYLEQSSKKVTLENVYEVFTSARRGLVKQSEYYESGRLSSKSSIGFNIIKVNELTYRSRTDDGSFKFNLNTLGIDGCVSKYYPVLKSITSIAFFNYFLNFYNKKIGLFATGSSQLVLSFKELSKISFKLPEAEEQTAIAEVLNTADQEIELLITQRNQLQLQKKGLMQQLLTGKKRLTING